MLLNQSTEVLYRKSVSRLQKSQRRENDVDEMRPKTHRRLAPKLPSTAPQLNQEVWEMTKSRSKARRSVNEARAQQYEERRQYDASVATRAAWFSRWFTWERAVAAAKDERSGTAPGKLLLIGRIDLDQYATAMDYFACVNRYRCTQGLPGGIYERPEAESLGDPDEIADAARADYLAADNALIRANASERYRHLKLKGSLQTIAIENKVSWPDVMGFKSACDVLLTHWR